MRYHLFKGTLKSRNPCQPHNESPEWDLLFMITVSRRGDLGSWIAKKAFVAVFLEHVMQQTVQGCKMFNCRWIFAGCAHVVFPHTVLRALRNWTTWRSACSHARLLSLVRALFAVFRGSKFFSAERILQLAHKRQMCRLFRGVNIWLSGAASGSGKSWVPTIFWNVKNRLSCSHRPRRFLAPSWVLPGGLLISEILTQIRLKWSWCVFLGMIFILVVGNTENHRELTRFSFMVSVLLAVLVRLQSFFWSPSDWHLSRCWHPHWANRWNNNLENVSPPEPRSHWRKRCWVLSTDSEEPCWCRPSEPD